MFYNQYENCSYAVLIVYLSISAHQKPTCLYLTYIIEIKFQ